jgi:hypothetical protein
MLGLLYTEGFFSGILKVPEHKKQAAMPAVGHRLQFLDVVFPNVALAP